MFLELVKKRSSCRKYSSKRVSQDSLQRCLESARLAPSACNSQPWKFIVIENADLKNKLAQAAFSGIYGVNAFAKNAPVLVAIIREKSKYTDRLASALRGVQYSLIDLGIVGEHFVLQAAEEGLSTCWIGWFHAKGVKKVLGLPRRTQVDILISLGYAEQQTEMVKKRNSLSEMSEYR